MVTTGREHVPTTNGNGATNSDRRFVWIQGADSSYNLGSESQLSGLPTTASILPLTGLQKGELAPHYEKLFTPLVALSRFPYKFCGESSRQDIASAFFDQGKFWAREWDL